MKILTVFYGSVWIFKNGEGTYEGEVRSKAFVIDDTTGLDDLKLKVISRFKINVEMGDLILAHLHPSQRLTSPYTIDDDEDLESFFVINESMEVPWSLPLYVSSSRSSAKAQRQHVMTVHHGVDRSSWQSSNAANSLQIEGPNQKRDKGDDTSEQFKDIDDAFDAASAKCNPHGGSFVSDFLKVGEIFNSKAEVKLAIEKVVISENFGYRVNKSTKSLLKLKCVDKECKWNFRASKLEGTEIFVIKSYNNVHTCSFEIRCKYRCRPSYKSVAEKIKRRYGLGAKGGPNPKTIQDDMRNDYSQDISYWKAWKAKEWAQNLIRGTPESNYRLLPSYLYMLREVNPGTYTNFQITEDDRFKYAFVSIGGSIRGFTFMRKVIMVDGTHLHGKYKGNLMIATAQDANNQIYPLAFAVVDSENDDSWTWFFQQLHNVIPSTDSLVIVSDRHKSIATSIEKVYSSALHVVCTRHLKENLKNLFKKKGIHDLFQLACDSYTEDEFHHYFNKITEMSPRMRDYLEKAKVERWARAYCQGDRYNIMTTNNSESINSVLREARSYQLVALLEYIRDLLSRWFYKRRELVAKNQNQLPPHVREVVQGRYTESMRYEVKFLNHVQFEVVGGNFTGLVDLARKTCSCRVFDLDHIPCAHAIAAILKAKGNIGEFVSIYYQHSTWANSYQETIMPVPMRSQWVVPNDVTSIICYAPNVRNQSGRPRKKRLRSAGEFRKSVTIKKKKTTKCGTCGNQGHNKRSCKFKASSSKDV